MIGTACPPIEESEWRAATIREPGPSGPVGLGLLVRMAPQRVARHLGDHQAADYGPSVQNPIADARPSCGEKSRIRAGVATGSIPSTRLTAAYRTCLLYTSDAADE